MGKPLHFKGSAFHRVIPQFMCARTARAHAAICTRLPLLGRAPPRAALFPDSRCARVARAAMKQVPGR